MLEFKHVKSKYWQTFILAFLTALPSVTVISEIVPVTSPRDLTAAEKETEVPLESTAVEAVKLSLTNGVGASLFGWQLVY